MKTNLTTKYLGLTLRNPLIVSSSGLTSSIDKVLQVARAGAGAVVLKSIFEEQIASCADSLAQYSDYPEAEDYLRGYVSGGAMNDYLELIRAASSQTTIPIIASINCTSAGSWVSYAKQIENAGAAALELNIFTLSTDPTVSAAQVEAQYLTIIDKVRAATNLPLSVKLPPHFTAPLNIVQQLYYRGVRGVVLFNRFYSTDIDITRLAPISGSVFSSPEELHNSLRYTALCAALTPLIDVAVSTGVHSSSDAVKALLAGATAVELCSTLYAHGVEYLGVILEELDSWAV
ncbi:MAG: dihydroorotate dehydrogenase-like protein, partial [Mucinivorans sp.]